jgi:excisionase family DNA binding protein
MKENERLNEVEATAKRQGVSHFTLRRQIKAGNLRAVRIGRRLLIPESVVEAVIAEGCGKHAQKSL